MENQSDEVARNGNNFTNMINARTSTGMVTPVLWEGPQGGNAECGDTGTNYAFSSSRNNTPFSDATAWPEGFTITTDGKLVSWSYIAPAGMCVDGVSFIVKGGDAANIYTYGPDIYGDSGLASPMNSSGGPADLSNLTVCFNLRECKTIEEPCYKEETAWSFGAKYVTKGNWATFTEYADGKTVDLFAGQSTKIGTVSFVDAGTMVKITIQLNEMGAFQNVAENIKIQGYVSAPKANPNPGLFTSHKGQAAGDKYEIEVSKAKFYGIHVDAARIVECSIN
ncbi:hypothetical protein [Rhodonellum sp.]|uniref:hypothetical protein n=1 Tax=Rhodonellum sp. TaxID=2231180 RepID=UPI0027187BB4|nr:hypothetical protein [Rhodonellum sp.]MDO9551696.1 hypothetical protein [Rhodonellum sp.]